MDTGLSGRGWKNRPIKSAGPNVRKWSKRQKPPVQINCLADIQDEDYTEYQDRFEKDQPIWLIG